MLIRLSLFANNNSLLEPSLFLRMVCYDIWIVFFLLLIILFEFSFLQISFYNGRKMAMAFFRYDVPWIRYWAYILFYSVHWQFLACTKPYYAFWPSNANLYRHYLYDKLTRTYFFDFFHLIEFSVSKKNRSSILLSCGMGNVKTEIEKWSGRVYCGWTSDCADWFAIRYNRNKICPLDMAWYRSESLYVYHDLKPFHFVIPFIYSFCIF